MGARARNTVVLMGHSMGGNLALGYSMTGRPAPDLLVLSAPALAGGAGLGTRSGRTGEETCPDRGPTDLPEG